MPDDVTFTTGGMSCASCVARVERALTDRPGVQEVAANLATGAVRVRYKAPADLEDLASTLRSTGYPPDEAEALLDVSGMSCASCVGRVERALATAPGVTEAHVNIATGRAHVRHLAGVTNADKLAGIVTRAGYAAQSATRVAASADAKPDEVARLKQAVLVAVLLAAPVVILAMGTHMVPAFHRWVTTVPGEITSWWIQMVLTTAILVGPGREFFRHGIPALLRGAPEMNTLVALGSFAAFAYSAIATLAPGLLPPSARHVYFEAAATIVTLILVGRLLEARAKGQAGEAIGRLVGLRPDTAHVVRQGATVEEPVSALLPGDIVQLHPGERVAADGVVTEGEGWVDEAMLTGEPAPARKSPGDIVTGGTVNGAAALRFRVTATGEDTTLSRIVAMVSEAQGAKLPVQALVDRITGWFVPVVMALSALAFAGWLIWGPEPALTYALIAAISVLIIACPCAMGLATPMSVLVGTGRGAELGVLFRRGDALQQLSEVGLIAFDKTGTLTEGLPQLTDLIPLGAWGEDDILKLAAAAEAQSEHPLARAILLAASERGIPLPGARSVKALPGRGLSASVEGHDVLVGNPGALTEAGIDIGNQTPRIEALAAEARTPILVAIDGTLAALIGVADPVKPGSGPSIAQLSAMGVGSAMISGDNAITADAVARGLGVEKVVAEVMPDGKVAALKSLAHGRRVAFVGDGINDAPALAAADIGIAMGTGTDVAIEAAEVVLMRGDPGAVVDAVRLSRATMRNIRQNLFWAFGYNVVLIPVAAGALYPLNGMLLSPMLAAGAMALSSVFVVTNALRLRRAGPWRRPVNPAP